MYAFPKIYALGTPYIQEIFDGEVEITEKVDGSQFGFGKIDGELRIRSKGKEMYPGAPEKMFSAGIDYVVSIEDRLPDNVVFHGEYLRAPKHNVLAYERVPANHIILFSVSDNQGTYYSHDKISEYAQILGLEVVPLMHRGEANSDKVLELMDTMSVLGGAKIEGLVVKNYHKQFLLGGHPTPVMAGKYVSEAFKEVHRKSNWDSENKWGGRWPEFKAGYATEARWEKAIQYLRDSGKLTSTSRDIGVIIKRIQQDITEEEKEIILGFLWKEFGRELLSSAVKGVPEFYKKKLLEGTL